MANVDDPHGLRPLGFTRSGGPLVVKEFTKDQGVTIYSNDAVHRVSNGSIKATGVPGSILYSGVALQFGDPSRAAQILTVVSPDAVFEAQSNDSASGIVAANAGLDANLILNAGSPKTLISGHEVDTNTMGSNTNLDVKLLGLLNVPDNEEGEFARIEIIINKHGMVRR